MTTEASCDPTEDFEGGSGAGGNNDHEVDEEDGNQVDGSGDEKKTKKIRTTFTGRQIFELETMFEHKKYLSSSERLDLSQRLNVTEQQVSRYYRNRGVRHCKFFSPFCNLLKFIVR